MADTNNNGKIDYDESSRLSISSVEFRTCSLAKNAGGYTPNNLYCAGVPDTISDGDNRGRDPQENSLMIGTKIDIGCRDAAIKKNSALYTPSHQYCSGTA